MVIKICFYIKRSSLALKNEPNVRFIYREQTERLKLGQKCPVFRQRLKTELFDNQTISKSAEIRTFGFQTFTVD